MLAGVSVVYQLGYHRVGGASDVFHTAVCFGALQLILYNGDLRWLCMVRLKMQGDLFACTLRVQPVGERSIQVNLQSCVQQWQVAVSCRQLKFKLNGVVLAVQGFQKLACFWNAAYHRANIINITRINHWPDGVIHDVSLEHSDPLDTLLYVRFAIQNLEFYEWKLGDHG